MADTVSTTDQFKVPLTEVTTDQNGAPFADVVTWTIDNADVALADVTDTSVTVVPGDFAEGSDVTATVTATDSAGLTATQVITFTGTVAAPVATTLEISAGAPEPK